LLDSYRSRIGNVQIEPERALEFSQAETHKMDKISQDP